MSEAEFTKLIQQYQQQFDSDFSINSKDVQVGHIISSDIIFPLGMTGYYMEYDIVTGHCLEIKYHPERDAEFDALLEQFNALEDRCRYYYVNYDKGTIHTTKTLKPEFQSQSDKILADKNCAEQALIPIIDQKITEICSEFNITINFNDREYGFTNIIGNLDIESTDPKFNIPEEWYDREDHVKDGILRIYMLKKSKLYLSLKQNNLV